MGCSASIQPIMFQVCPMDGHEEVNSSGHARSGRGSSKISSGFEVQVAWQEDDMQASLGEHEFQAGEETQVPEFKVQPRANSQVPGDSNDELDELVEFNNMKVVSGPVDLQSYNSLDFDPTYEDLEPKRKLAPCAPSQRMYLKSLEMGLGSFQKKPGLLEGLALCRRRLFDERVLGQEGMVFQEFLVDW
ncbi:unnamed protein product [Polarella glacialis]|uniref:Uncharacterized protein n=1 Tax=Polarella glacialis TaxID=89957 RepID=A0A813FZM5_POLGL|nr:unnamed protein product [Polarella glacialis]CAE8618035.1 unnamed protein product [Polarella glacialis]CAE8740075.1 unnamed protein product [Polarella glacialis]